MGLSVPTEAEWLVGNGNSIPNDHDFWLNVRSTVIGQSLSCPSSNGFRFWSHEWEKHGACSESESQLDQHEYFEAALNLKKKVNLLQILRIAIIEPDDEFYSLDNIVKAIIKGIGHTPRIGCNKDSDGNSQLYQIYFWGKIHCVSSASKRKMCFKCPVSKVLKIVVED
ncbi:ribonuclease 3-like [Castanea sativa]|uniref:ribonuclease 3-like n=1 Tax=Castanea sativa TaxID=21020 RepID=UPI003F64FB7B